MLPEGMLRAEPSIAVRAPGANASCGTRTSRQTVLPEPPLETYSVVVTGVQLQDLLFALARDAHLNVDIHPGITGRVTLNAINQTLPQILARISRQADVRFE